MFFLILLKILFTVFNDHFDILLGTENTVSQNYDIKDLPTTYLINKEEHIRYRAVGGREFDHPKVETNIQSLMQK